MHIAGAVAVHRQAGRHGLDVEARVERLGEGEALQGRLELRRRLARLALAAGVLVRLALLLIFEPRVLAESVELALLFAHELAHLVTFEAGEAHARVAVRDLGGDLRAGLCLRARGVQPLQRRRPGGVELVDERLGVLHAHVHVLAAVPLRAPCPRAEVVPPPASGPSGQ